MSQRQKSIALKAVVASIAAVLLCIALSTFVIQSGSAGGFAHADEPNPLLTGSVQPSPTPAFDVEAVRAAFDAAEAVSGKMEVLRAAGVKPWNPPSALPPPTAPSELELSPESEAAIEDIVSELPEGKRAIARGFLEHRLAD